MMNSRIRPKDPRGGHVRLHWDLLDSHAWRAISWGDQGLYVALRRRLRATNNGDIEATLGSLRHYGISSSASLAKGLRALAAVGLIAKTRQGGLSQGRRVCNLYRFTDEEVLENPTKGIPRSKATNEWRGFKNLAEAKAALCNAHKNAKTGVPRPLQKNTRPVRNPTAKRSASELDKREADSRSEGAVVIRLDFRRPQ
jgi:hypothetical protein